MQVSHSLALLQGTIQQQYPQHQACRLLVVLEILKEAWYFRLPRKEGGPVDASNSDKPRRWTRGQDCTHRLSGTQHEMAKSEPIILSRNRFEGRCLQAGGGIQVQVAAALRRPSPCSHAHFSPGSPLHRHSWQASMGKHVSALHVLLPCPSPLYKILYHIII